MPRKSQKLLVQVQEIEGSEEHKVFHCQVKVDRMSTEMSDIVVRQGGGVKLERMLEGALKDAVQVYAESGKEFFRAVLSSREARKNGLIEG